MGAWGTALFSDDLAADLRDDYRDLIGDGCSASQAAKKLKTEYAEVLEDADDAAVFWLALAAAQWSLGHTDPVTQRTAIKILERGGDLRRWEFVKDRKKREKVLSELLEKLKSPPSKPKKVPKQFKEANDWTIGEVIGFRLSPGRWTLFRTIGHHEDKGGKFAICELLDWIGEQFPSKREIDRLSIRPSKLAYANPQFFFQGPRSKKDRERLVRLGVISTPSQTCGMYGTCLWKRIDQDLKDHFGIE